MWLAVIELCVNEWFDFDPRRPNLVTRWHGDEQTGRSWPTSGVSALLWLNMGLLISNYQQFDCVFNSLFDQHQIKHQTAHLAFARGTGGQWIPLTKGHQCGKHFYIMTSSCKLCICTGSNLLSISGCLILLPGRSITEKLICNLYTVCLYIYIARIRFDISLWNWMFVSPVNCRMVKLDIL